MTDRSEWKILLVDDDPASREAMTEWLERRGFRPQTAATGEAAIAALDESVAVVVTDLKMPHTSGLEVLRATRTKSPHAAVIVVSGHGTVDTAVTALKEGAFDFLTKPINLKELTHRINMALEKRAMAAEIAQLHHQLRKTHRLENIIGNSAPMRQLFEKIRMVADTRATVLVIGESGTGKELVARSIHQLSPRQKNPFIPVNCAAIPETLVESELFGHEKGAFTGAAETRLGLFQAAHQGTLFIDEIGELPLGLQGKLLRVIENKKVMMVGSTRERDVDVRLVAATNRDLQERIRENQFREDLYFRLKVVELRIPPLRERAEDIPLLVRHFIDQLAEEHHRNVRDIDSEALERLQRHDWPGNVRELRNTLESIIVLSNRDRIRVDDLPDHLRSGQARGPLIASGMTMREIEREAIRRSLEQTGGHRAKTAELLGLSVRTLQRKIKEYGLADEA